MSIRFGVCTSPYNIPALIDAGYDYVEGNFTDLVRMTDGEFEKIKAVTEKYKFYVESFNCFFPGEIRLTGADVDFSIIRSHVISGIERAATLGGRVFVIGSGGSRRVPDGFDFETGYSQFAKALCIVGDVAAQKGITVVVEPLQSCDTNLINTVEQGIELVKKINHPNVKALADFYHVYRSGESLDAIRNNNGWLAHLHLARANDDRAMPYEEDIPKTEEWAEAVRVSGYEGRLSLEGSYLPDFVSCIERTRKIIACFNS